jgi:hypothetical protein
VNGTSCNHERPVFGCYVADALTTLLTPQGYRLLVTLSRDAARALLVQDEEIVFVVSDIEDHLTLAQAQSWFLENRAQIAWARLPSAVLVPQNLAAEQTALRDSGVMGAMFNKPVDYNELVQHIRRSRAL